MLKRTFAVTLSAALLALSLGLTGAGAQTVNAAAERTRAAVAKLGVGEKARVEVRLLDKTKVKGYVSEASADSFAVMDARTGALRTFSYADVAEVRKRPRTMSGRTQAILWGGIAAGVAVTLYTVRGAFCDGMC